MTIRTQHSRARSGFTLVETVISMTIIIAVMAMGTRLFMEQTRMLSQQSGRLEAQHNAQFSLATLDREMRVAGIGVVDKQPIVVQAGDRAFTFNADLVSRVLNDPSAVYIDQDAPLTSTVVYSQLDAQALPMASAAYPETTYSQPGGVASAAETISFWVSRDLTSPAENEYLLYRRVNSDPAQVVARGLRVNPTDTVFQYFKRDTAGNSVPISPAALPLLHSAPIHGSTADTAGSALIDSIRTVRVRLTAMYKDRNGIQIIRRIDMTIQLMNAGLIRRSSCGEAPIGVTATATVEADTANAGQMVRLAWDKSADEGEGEKDVERYAIFRRPSSEPAFSEPLASIPGGSSSYTFYDHGLASGSSWVYGVTAQDCTPNSSSIGSTSTVIIP